LGSRKWIEFPKQKTGTARTHQVVEEIRGVKGAPEDGTSKERAAGSFQKGWMPELQDFKGASADKDQSGVFQWSLFWKGPKQYQTPENYI